MVIVIAALLSRSAFSRALNPARGRSASARSSRSIPVYSGMGSLHARSERLQRALLQLLDGALALPQARRDLADAALLDIALDDHGALVRGQLLDEPEDRRHAIDLVEVLVDGRLCDRRFVGDRLVTRSLRAIVQRVGGNPDQPRAERRAAPLVAWQLRQRLVKHLRRDVFRGVAVAHPADHECVHTMEMALVEIAELRRVALRRFDQEALIRVGHRSQYINDRRREKLRYDGLSWLSRRLSTGRSRSSGPHSIRRRRRSRWPPSLPARST